MVTTGTSPRKVIIFTTRYTSLGRKRDRWCIVIPPPVSRLLDKNKIVQVVLTPVGSVG